MPIVHHRPSRSFFLQGASSTYAFRVGHLGHLEHLHWGARVEPGDLGHALPRHDRPFCPNPVGDDRSYSLDTAPQECPTAGASDFRAPALAVEHADGSRQLDLVYRAHRIARGKPRLPGLPATYAERPGEATTLIVELADRLSGVRAELRYTVFEGTDCLARSLRVVNGGRQAVAITRVLSASVDLPTADWRLLQLSGAWARERRPVLSALRPGLQGVGSRRGTSSHQHNPFIALLGPDAGEEHGEVLGFSLVYSGSFTAEVEVDQFATARAQLGIQPEGFRWELAPGAAFEAPEAVLVRSAAGLGAMSRAYHRLYRERLCRGRWRDAARPVLINNWEATYFNFDTAKLLAIGRTARQVGVRLLVLDDGWFGKREDDRSGLGDWVVNGSKLPGGLGTLARGLKKMGMRFGLWFEPEMVSPDSDLYRAHPDWCLHVPGRTRSQARSQLVLDLGRAEVRDFACEAVAKVLRSGPIGYVKWDMNRSLTEVWNPELPAHRQGEAAHRYVLGLYEILERLQKEFPEVLWEGCSGGGGRFDPGLLHWFPQYWCSDNSDAIARLGIQWGTSIAYPLSAISAHVSAVPNHQVGRTTPMATRGLVAMTPAFGFELDLGRLSPEDLAVCKGLVADHRRWERLLRTGDLHRLVPPWDGRACAWMVVSPDRREALVTWVRILAEANAPQPVLRLRGLDPRREYRWQGGRLGGDALMAVGLRPRLGGDFQAQVWHLRAAGG